MGFIYKITNNLNEKFYIGQTTKTIEERWKRHKWDLNKPNKKSRFYNALTKYGIENFRVEMIEETTDLDIREKFWIAKLEPQYNITPGGFGPPIMSGINNPMYGKTRHDLAARNKICKPNKGKFGKDHPRAKTYKFTDASGNDHIAKGFVQFCRDNKLSSGSLTHRKKYKGWTYQLLE